MNSSIRPLQWAFLIAKWCHLDQSMILENESSFSAGNRQEAGRTGHPIGRFAIKMSVKEFGGNLLVTQSCLTLCMSDPLDYSPPGSSDHGISQARILEWVAIPFSRGSSRPRDQTHISCTSRQILYRWATRKAQWKETTDKKKIANTHFNEPITVYESGTWEYLKD